MRSVRVEQLIQAPKDRIWRACASAAGLRSWQADQVEGKFTRGEALMLGWSTLGVAVELEIERIEHERSVVLTAEDSRLELEIEDGRVALSHSADFDDDESDGTLSSWRLSLATLAHYLKHHDGEERHVHWSVSRAKASIEDAHAFFTLAGAQSAWLTRAGGTGVGAVGSGVALDLAWGSPLNGSVLSHTEPRDVLISWRETNDSVLALRTLPSPDAPDERLLIATWSSWGLPDPNSIEQNLDAAVTRLARAFENRASA